MKKELKKELKTAFEAPKPIRKHEFLSSINYPRVSRFGFLATQICYVRKRVWAVSFLFMLAVLVGLPYQTNESILIWTISALLPFITLIGITEISRSMSYNMAELEMSCKYSFSDIILARLLILGIANAILFIFIMLSILRISSMGVFTLVMHLFTPYLLSCSLSLFVLNRLRTKESLYICGCVSIIVGALSLVLFNPNNPILPKGNWLFWCFLILLFWVAVEVIKLIKKTEENKWNSSLTV